MNPFRRPPIAAFQLTADIVILTVREQRLGVLLVERDGDPFAGSLALPGGFVWQDEPAETTAQRILQRKVGAGQVFFEQLYTFDAPGRDPRGRIATIAYYALVPESMLASGLQPATRLLPVDKAQGLAFDHDKIIEKALARVQSKLAYSNIAYSLLPELFTLSQLQSVYETILGKSLDKRNFRKKMVSLGLLQPTDQHTEGAAHRPAGLYRFTRRDYTELDEPAF